MQAQLDCPACAHCLAAMQQALDRTWKELHKEGEAYDKFIKAGRQRGLSGGAAELATERELQAEALRELEEQLEVCFLGVFLFSGVLTGGVVVDKLVGGL
jgi:hypothetical protein